MMHSYTLLASALWSLRAKSPKQKKYFQEIDPDIFCPKINDE